MKTLLAVLTIGGLMTAGAVFAGEPALKVNVPFDFLAAGKQMPAGEYLLVKDATQRSMMITARDASAAVRVPFHPGDDNTTGFDAAVAFHKYGGTHILEQVWTNNGPGVKFSKTKAEREIASAATEEKTVAISLVR